MPELQANGGTPKYCSKRLIFGKESHFTKSHIEKKVGWDTTKRGDHDRPSGGDKISVSLFRDKKVEKPRVSHGSLDFLKA